MPTYNIRIHADHVMTGSDVWTRREFLSAAAMGGAGLALLGCAGGAPTITSRARLDLVIIGGSVVDGTGAAVRRADVGVRDGIIASVGDLSGAEADRVIDATGLHVAPGFIDIHSHVDTSLLRDPKAESKVHQGVTTEASGMDGESPAPIGGPALQHSLDAFKEEFGFECPYRDMDGFLAALERKKTAQNMVVFVGLGTVRDVVLGPDDRPATREEITSMRREVTRAIEQGARGTSTGLEYTPGSFATPAELAEVIRVVPERYRIYATHMRNEGDTVLEAVDEAIRIARDSGARLQVSHLKAQNPRNWNKQGEALKRLDDAIAAGIDVHADRYPYVAFATDLTSLFPLWSRDGGTEKFLARLSDRDSLARMRKDVERKVEGLGSWETVLISSVNGEDNKRFQGKTVARIALEEQVDPFTATVRLLVQEQARVGMVGFGMDEAGTEMVLAWKNTMVASDGGAYSPSRPSTQPHPRCYGTFPRAIGHYQRQRKITSLPEMIRKMTSMPAHKLGLADRGVISAGKAADIVLFDYATINDRATFVEPHQFPEGIPFVIVNGIPVVDGGRQSDALPGKVLRSV
jgi:N-acyl-D-amino-acid deacylase